MCHDKFFTRRQLFPIEYQEKIARGRRRKNKLKELKLEIQYLDAEARVIDGQPVIKVETDNINIFLNLTNGVKILICSLTLERGIMRTQGDLWGERL